MSTTTAPWDYDVIQIGFGPVGQTLAALLGQKGHRVGVFERQDQAYPLPRAGHVDHEIMRILQDVGAAEEFEPHAIPIPNYDWFNGAGELLLHLDWNQPTPSGWKSDYLMFQPDLQDALINAVRRHPSVSVNYGLSAIAVRQFDDHVQIDLARRVTTGSREDEVRTVTAAYVIGADGANSAVRQLVGLNWVDLGFEEAWLVVDVQPHDPELHIDMPEAGQICDPERPVSLFRWLGRGHARWEFMLLPGEDPEAMKEESRCWRFLAQWGLTSETATIIRRTVYTFRSLLSDSWRRGRALLIGDAAHLMPPFMGQGMCSGIRDSANLAWKLDLVLSGRAEASLLDTYTVERRPHVQQVIEASMGLGQVVCISDPTAAAARDEAFKTGQVPPPPPFPWLTDGVLQRGNNGQPTDAAGKLSVQPRVHYRGRTGLFDDLIGSGWVLMTRVPLAKLALTDAHVAGFEVLGGRIVHVTRASVPGAVIDMDAQATRWFDELGADVVLVRPDFYVFGAAGLADAGDLIDSLLRQVHLKTAALSA